MEDKKIERILFVIGGKDNIDFGRMVKDKYIYNCHTYGYRPPIYLKDNEKVMDCIQPLLDCLEVKIVSVLGRNGIPGTVEKECFSKHLWKHILRKRWLEEWLNEWSKNHLESLEKEKIEEQENLKYVFEYLDEQIEKEKNGEGRKV